MLARVLAATVAGGITFFVLGFVIYGMILDPLVLKPGMNPEAAKFMKDSPEWVFLVLYNLVGAFLLAYIFDKWATIRTFAGGFLGGALVYFLIALYMQLMFAALMNIWHGPIPVIADLIGTTIIGGVGGGVVGIVLGKMNK